MGCCNSVCSGKNGDKYNISSLETRPQNTNNGGGIVEYVEDVVSPVVVNEGETSTGFIFDQNTHRRSSVAKLVLEFLVVLRVLNGNEDMSSSCLQTLRDIAEKENGWLDVVISCIENIPIESDLGPAVISVLLDECPLAPKETLYSLLSMLGLTSDKNSTDFKPVSSTPVWRNTAIVLGNLADKLAGPQSAWLFTDEVLQFLLARLTVNEHPSVVLFSIITLEKFAKTIENKERIKSTKIAEYLSELEKRWITSDNCLEHQAAFCAQWCLDNSFPLEGRPYSYENTNLEGINAMLNVNDVSAYLKISPNGLEARSDAPSFESVRSTYCVESGTWFYEVVILTSGVMQIGWATKQSRFLSHEGYGIGDDPFSIAFDGCRQLIWFEAESEPVSCLKWEPDDVLGMVLIIEENKVIFYLNGVSIEKQFPAKGRGAFFAAASFMSFQHCKFNFGAQPFKYPPRSISFNTFNNHARLSEQQKMVLPRHIKMTELKQEHFHVDSCTICYERIANATLLPCGHGQLCLSCAKQLQLCPMCRCTIEDVETQLITEV